ncbi:hypothetical protein CYK37_27430 [Mesorhizobium loti]|nr:hypothetical protein [Mesorhizobium loti]PLP56012.1 hypothetical protein CYK37_27430 [Mesorhizobium loti]
MKKSILSALGLAVALAFAVPALGTTSANAAEVAKHVVHTKHHRHHSVAHKKYHAGKHHARKHHSRHHASRHHVHMAAKKA